MAYMYVMILLNGYFENKGGIMKRRKNMIDTLKAHAHIYMASTRENLSLGFAIRSYPNQPAQLQLPHRKRLLHTNK